MKKQKTLFKRRISKKGILKVNTDIRCEYGIMSLDNYLITKKELECCRVLIKRELKKKGNLYVYSKFNIPITKKASGVRMGKGKGPIKTHCAKVLINTFLFEFDTEDIKIALTILKKISYKLAIKIVLFSKTNNTIYNVK